MMINFDNPLYLLSLAALIPLIVFIHFFSLKYIKRKALKFANFEAIERVTGTQIISKNYVILYLEIFIVLFFVLALSGPVIKYSGEVASRNFVLAIDASGSMAAQDIEPNRLEAAKQMAIEFVDSLTQQSKMGVVSFAGTTFIEQGITKDREKIKNSISAISLKPVGGTDLLNAIITSTNLIKISEKKGAIILLTDGQFNVKNLEDILNYTSDKNVPIYSLGIGSEEGGYFEDGMLSTLEESSLKNISNYTDGKYYECETKAQLKSAYNEIAAIKREQKTFELSILLFIASLALILISWFLVNTKYKTLP